MRRHLVLLSALTVTAMTSLIACVGDETDDDGGRGRDAAAPDAARDATFDAGPRADASDATTTADATIDATVDATSDATDGASADASADAADGSSVDASADAADGSSVDASADAADGSPIDAGVDAGADATDGSSVDAGSMDAGPEAPFDASLDAAGDGASFHAGPGTDASADASPADASTFDAASCGADASPGCSGTALGFLPGSGAVFVYSKTGNTLQADLDTGSGYAPIGTTTLAGEGIWKLGSVASGTVRVSSTAPALVFVHDGNGGDKVTAGSSASGELRANEIVTWAGHTVTVLTHDAAPTSVRLQGWSGAAWLDLSTWSTPATASFHSFSAPGSDLYRVVADAPVTAIGQELVETYNHFAYLPPASPARLQYAYAEPAGATGVRRFVVQALAASTGITIDNGGSTHTATLAAAGDYDVTTFAPSTRVGVTASAPVLAWIEADPGFPGDGSILDADMVPGTSGAVFDTSFLFRATVAAGANNPSRYADVDVFGYEDGTTVTVLANGVPMTAMTVDRGKRLRVATNAPPGTLYAITTSKRVMTEQSHEGFQFSFRVPTVSP